MSSHTNTRSSKHIFNLKREKLTHLPKRQLRAGAPLPHSCDLSTKSPPIYDQGDIGSCTSNSLLAVLRFHDANKNFSPSRLFHYYCERQADGDVSEDGGSTISQSVSVLKKIGVCSESTWPYITSKFAQQPPHKAYTEAAYHKALQAVIVAPDTQTVKTYITQGYPINIGISVYEELESDQAAKTGIVPMPGPNSQNIGGHAVWIVGYDDTKTWTDNNGAHQGMWKLTNSWGPAWGDKGKFYLPYEYLKDENLASDFWNLQKIEDLPNHVTATWHDHTGKEVSHDDAIKAYDAHFAAPKLATE